MLTNYISSMTGSRWVQAGVSNTIGSINFFKMSFMIRTSSFVDPFTESTFRGQYPWLKLLSSSWHHYQSPYLREGSSRGDEGAEYGGLHGSYISVDWLRKWEQAILVMMLLTSTDRGKQNSYGRHLRTRRLKFSEGSMIVRVEMFKLGSSWVSRRGSSRRGEKTKTHDNFWYTSIFLAQEVQEIR